MLIALTGGIGSGKSTIAKRWVELGATEIDADQLAREVVEPGTEGLRQVVEQFGEEILDSEDPDSPPWAGYTLIKRTGKVKIIFHQVEEEE